MRLKNKVAIVTGAASGIGKATAWSMSREGASLVISDINMEGAEKVACEIGKSGGRALPIGVDISKENEVEQMVKKRSISLVEWTFWLIMLPMRGLH